MTPGELAWRVGSRIRDESDRYRLKWGLYPQLPPGLPLYPREGSGCRLSPVPLAAWHTGVPDGLPVEWRQRLLDRADAIAAHRLSFFDLENVDVGNPIDWNRDHGSGIAAPRDFSAGIDYRDHRVAGDAKVVWEPNRHHQLVVLARAYRVTGNDRYAEAMVEQLESWLEQCPFGFGMNWRSPLELAIRLINWTWALDLIADYRSMPTGLQRSLLESIYLHVWDVTRKYSRGSSANNHLIGEACGVFFATSYFTQLPGAAGLRKESQAILEREIVVQTYPSGATREQAFGYHLFVLQLFLHAGLLARRMGDGFSTAYWQRLERMFEFAGAMAEGGPAPSFGDADDAYVLDLGDSPRDVGALMRVGLLVLPGSTLAGAARHSETAYWVCGSEVARSDAAPPVSGTLASSAFADAGYYLLQWGDRDARDQVSVLFDCGELGFTALAAHGHADALSFTVRAFGVEMFVDPGTFDYFTYPEWRRYFRSTSAHNTVGIDREDQSVLLGSFLWGTRAKARRLDWQPRPGGGTVAGEHDGYTRLPDPVVCSRSLTLDQATRTLRIIDRISAKGRHDAVLYFHLSELCEVERHGSEIRIDCGEGRAILRLPAGVNIELHKGGSPGQGGWVSRGYHRRVPAWTIVARAETRGPAELNTVIEISEPLRR
jgi:Heparinase II/III-like protein/Heparinase II/III N-terminus